MGIVSLKLITMLKRHASYLDILSHGKIKPQRCCVMKTDPAPLPMPLCHGTMYTERRSRHSHPEERVRCLKDTI